MTHKGSWDTIDQIASLMGLSCSGLARACKLDPTTFNKSKRWTRDGKPRWLSLGTVAKILGTAGVPRQELIKLLFREEYESFDN